MSKSERLCSETPKYQFLRKRLSPIPSEKLLKLASICLRGDTILNILRLPSNGHQAQNPPHPPFPPFNVNPYFDARITRQQYLLVWDTIKVKHSQRCSYIRGSKIWLLKAVVFNGSSPKGCQVIHSKGVFEVQTLQGGFGTILEMFAADQWPLCASPHLILFWFDTIT